MTAADSTAAAAPMSMPRARRLLILGAIASLALWYVPYAFVIAYPLRMFGTLIHEGSHGLATILSGGRVMHIALMPNGSGVTYSQGGALVLIYQAGYLGAVAFGAAVLLYTRRGRGRGALWLMGLVSAAITVLWVRDVFSMAIGVLLASVLVLLGSHMKPNAADLTAAFLGVQLCLNAVFDVRSLLWLTTATDVGNDAVFMSQAYGLPPVAWALLWGVASLGILALGLRTYLRGR